MNPKFALFLSATMTVLFGVVTRISTTPAAESAAIAQAEPASLVAQQQPAPASQTPLSPDQAAALAAAAINRQDVYSVETSIYQGVDGYRVVFSSGDVVTVGLDSQVLATSKLQAAVVSASPTPAPVISVLGANFPAQPYRGKEHEGHD